MIKEWLTVLDAMRVHDDNEELHSLYEGKKVMIGWTRMWFDWSFGISMYFREHPGVWLNFGPLTLGVYKI